MMKGFRYVPFCPNIALAANGDIHFSSRFPIGDFGALTFATLSAIDLNVQTGDGIKTQHHRQFSSARRLLLSPGAAYDERCTAFGLGP